MRNCENQIAKDITAKSDNVAISNFKCLSFVHTQAQKIMGCPEGTDLQWRPQNAKHFEALTEPAGETHPLALGFK